MLGMSLAMLLGGVLLMLRLSPGGSFPSPLSVEEERRYLMLWQDGDVAARNVLVEHNLRLVAHIIKKYYTQTNDMEDLISIGTIGLIKGINTYKPDRGIRLATYASRCIENEILMSIRAERKQRGEVPLTDPIGVDRDGNEITLADVLSSDDDVCEKAQRHEEHALLRNAVNDALTVREKKVIIMRYGLFGSRVYAQREIGELLGISRSYVSRIEKRALKKLNAYMLSHGVTSC